MFGLFKSPPHDDPALGRFVHSWGKWRGNINLQNKTAIPLVLAGSRTAPDPNAIEIARKLPELVNDLRPAIEHELFEHCTPYLEAIRDGELPEPERLNILGVAKPADTWAFTEIRAVAIEPSGGALTTVIALASAWDTEHTLGVYIRDGRIVEFNGSI